MVGVFCFVFWQQRDPMETDVGDSPIDGDVDTLQQKPLLSKEDSESPNKASSEVQSVQRNSSETLTKQYYGRPVTAADMAEREQMLAKIFPLDTKSESDVINIIVGFYPEEHRADGLYEFYRNMYQEYDADETIEEKIYDMVALAQASVSMFRDWEEASKEELENAFERMRQDPVKFYESEIQSTKDQIVDIEAKLREAEAKGSEWWIEEYRTQLSILHGNIESDNVSLAYHKWQKAFDLGAKDFLIKHLEAKGYSVSPSKLLDYELPKSPEGTTFLPEAPLKELSGKPSESANDAPGSPSEASDLPTVPDASVSPSESFDPVVSLRRASQSLKTWRVDVDTQYFDVVVSQYMTDAELDKYFPTAQDKKILKSRTTEMQKSVVSKIREVVSGVKGATPKQKRQLARELVTANYEKSFAESVLKALEAEKD